MCHAKWLKIQKTCEIWTSSLPLFFISEAFWNPLKALCESVVWAECSDNLQSLLNYRRITPEMLALLFYLVFKLTKWLQTPLNSGGVSSFQVRATCVHPTSRTARSTTPRTSTPTGVWTSGLAPAAPWPPWQPPGARWRRAKTSSNPSWWLLSGAGWSRGKLWGFCWTRRLLTPSSRSWMTSPKPLS